MPVKWRHGTAGIHRNEPIRAAPCDICPDGRTAPRGAGSAGLDRPDPGAPLRSIGDCRARRRWTAGGDGVPPDRGGSPRRRPAVPPRRSAPGAGRRRALRRHGMFPLRSADADSDDRSRRAGARATGAIRRPAPRSHLPALPPSQALLAGLSERGAGAARLRRPALAGPSPRHRCSRVLKTTSPGMPAADRWRYRHRPAARSGVSETWRSRHVQTRQ